jgi:6-pyruvoyltetrahydropterin/6-carboxytetrahydropterin synthase
MGRITRKLEFDAAHRVMRHESKCLNLHGHRYVLEVTLEGELDPLGRVVDFGVVKSIFGTWLDKVVDHGVILNSGDGALLALCYESGWKHVILEDENPTAEVLADYFLGFARELLERDLEDDTPTGVTVTAVKLYETPNCWAVTTPEAMQRYNWPGVIAQEYENDDVQVENWRRTGRARESN